MSKSQLVCDNCVIFGKAVELMDKLFRLELSSPIPFFCCCWVKSVCVYISKLFIKVEKTDWRNIDRDEVKVT